MLPTNDVVLNSYFRVLRSTVDELRSRGYRTVGAVLKPQMRRRTGNNFSEHQLGFLKFGDFLRAAERAGFVFIANTPGGDLEVFPSRPGGDFQYRTSDWSSPAHTATAVAPQPSAEVAKPTIIPSAAPLRIRQDFWSAFNSFTPHWVYDAKSDRAVFLPAATSPAEDPVMTDLRFRLQRGDQAVRIPPASERMSRWMREFAESQDGSEHTDLLAAFSNDKPHVRFTAVVRSNIGLLRSWRRYHTEKLLTTIRAWADENRLSLPNLTLSLPDRPGPAFVNRILATSPIQELEDIQQSAVTEMKVASPRLLSAIDTLIDELLRFRGTLQYMDSKRK